MCFFRLTHFPCDDWESTHFFLIIIIKSEGWTIVHCLGLGHKTMVCAVCLSIFWSIWNLTGTSAVLLPVTFQRDRTILSTSLIYQLRHFTRSYDKTSYVSSCASVCICCRPEMKDKHWDVIHYPSWSLQGHRCGFMYTPWPVKSNISTKQTTTKSSTYLMENTKRFVT